MAYDEKLADLMLRNAPEEYEQALERTGCREMDFTGRPMKGFVFERYLLS